MNKFSIILSLLLLGSITAGFFSSPAKSSVKWNPANQLTSNEATDVYPSISGDGSKIAFQSSLDGDYEIFVVNSDGTELTQLTNNTRLDSNPSISGDGTKIAFQSKIDGDLKDTEILVVNSDGTELTQLTNNNAYEWYPVISGDGSKIAFESDVDGAASSDHEIFVMNSDGTGLIQLTNNSVEDSAPAISGNGSKIAFQSKVDGEYEVFVVNSDGTGLIQITNSAGWNHRPSISRDGTKIAYVSTGDGDYEISLINSDGTGLIQLTTNIAEDNRPSISGDGSKIAFYSKVDGDEEIFVVNSDGTGLTQITSNTPTRDWYPVISGDGSKIAFQSSLDGDQEIYLSNSEFVTEYTLTVGTTGSGSTSPGIGTYSYDEGFIASVSAVASSGWIFDYWLLDSVNVGSANPYLVNMNDDHQLTAVFEELPPPPPGKYYLTLAVTGSGSTSPPIGSHTYDEAEEVEVTAVASSGWIFDYWLFDSVNVGSENPYTVIMDANHDLTAVFSGSEGIYSSQLDELLPSREDIPTQFHTGDHENETLNVGGFLEGRSISYTRIFETYDLMVLWFRVYQFSDNESANAYFNYKVDNVIAEGGYTEVEIPYAFAVSRAIGDIEQGFSWCVMGDMVLNVEIYNNYLLEDPVDELTSYTVWWINDISESSTPTPSPSVTPSPTPSSSPEPKGFSLPMEFTYVAVGAIVTGVIIGAAIIAKKRK